LAVTGRTSDLVALCFDANDPIRLAGFWATALRWDVDPRGDEEVGLVPTDHTSFEIVFRRADGPKRGPNRIHLDLTTESIDDQDATVAGLLEIGGRHIDIGQRGDEGHVVLADPDGNELCIIEPGNNFLSTCERLGSITCDGTRAVGYFWSAALGWPLVWDQDEETAIRAPDATGPMITWGGPPVAPKDGKNRLHLEIAPPAGVSQDSDIERLVSLGATRLSGGPAGSVVMADPDDNEFWVLHP
jgi:hypothetical protein